MKSQNVVSMKLMGLLLMVVASGCRVRMDNENCNRMNSGTPTEGRWVALNEDCTNFIICWYFRSNPPPHLTKEMIRDYAKQYLKGPVTHYFVNPNAGQVAPFDSRYMDCMWRVHDARKCDCSGFQRYWVEETRRLAAEGVDAYAELMSVAKELGVHVWLSMRMNDNHFIKEPDRWAISDFQRNRRDLTREPGRKIEKGVGAWHFSQDYAHEEVRNENLKVVRELTERYDAEGLELDFTRHQFYFRPNHEREDAHLLTDFVRKARGIALQSAAARGRRDYGLAVRVPTTLQLCRAHGFDVDVWIREGLVDLVIPTCELNMNDFDLPVEKWLRLAAEAPHPVRIVPGSDVRVTPESRNADSRRLMTAAEYSGWIDNMYSRGATGLYFFNHYCIRQTETCRDDMGLSGDPAGLDPQAVRKRPRAYPVSHRDYWQLDGAGFDMSSRQLPVKLNANRSIRIYIGSVSEGERCSLKLGFDGALPKPVIDSIRVNGSRPSAIRTGAATKEWPGSNVRSVSVVACELPNGDVLTVYYQQPDYGEKPCLMATKWRVTK